MYNVQWDRTTILTTDDHRLRTSAQLTAQELTSTLTIVEERLKALCDNLDKNIPIVSFKDYS